MVGVVDGGVGCFLGGGIGTIGTRWCDDVTGGYATGDPVVLCVFGMVRRI